MLLLFWHVLVTGGPVVQTPPKHDQKVALQQTRDQKVSVKHLKS